MNLASINSIVPAETMIGIVLILLAAVVKGIRSLSKRLSLSRLTLSTESSTLHLQIKPHSSQQELLQLEQPGDDENDRSTNDDGRIPSTDSGLKF